MKAIIVSILGRLLFVMAVLGFTLGLVLGLNEPKYLWFLWLLLLGEMIPTYQMRTTKNQDNTESINITESDE